MLTDNFPQPRLDKSPTLLDGAPVWLLLDSRHFGGIESHVLQLACALDRQKIKVEVIFLADYGEHALKTRLAQAGIGFSCLQGHGYRLLRRAVKEKPQLLHTHGYKAGLLGRLCGLFARLPVISSFHAGEKLSGKLAWYQLLDRLSSVLCREIIAVSEPIKARLPARARLINNFVAVNPPQKKTARQLAFVGRLSHEKGPDTFIELAREFPGQLFHLYGSGPMEQQLKQQATDNVIFHGAKENMASLWPEIGLLIMPSRFEGLPMAALEAMSNSTPVLAYRVGSMKKLLTDENGYLIPPQDFSRLKIALTSYLGCDDTARTHMSQQARSTIKAKFSADAVLPGLLELYRKSIKAKV